MKTLLILVLLLLLSTLGLGYNEYRQSVKIADLEFQVSVLQTQVSSETAILVSQQVVIAKEKRREAEVEKVVFKIVDFLSHLEIEVDPSSGNGSKS
jgi:hypothetical protein